MELKGKVHEIGALQQVSETLRSVISLLSMQKTQLILNISGLKLCRIKLLCLIA